MYNPNQSPSSRRAGEEFLRRMNQNQFQNCVSCGTATTQQQPTVDRRNACEGCCEQQESGMCNPSHNPFMPALAMVYAPHQEWTCLMETPGMALAHGTLFKELFKPFEGRGSRRGSRC